jgi:hypothetical protein
METPEGLIWSVAGGVITASLIALGSYIYNCWNDRVRLVATLSQPGDYLLQQRIGCACLIVTVACKGHRVAKIRGAFITLEGVNLLPYFEKGFGESFGYTPSKVGDPPSFVVDLIPLRKPECSDGFILERDDVVKFVMPIQVPALDKFVAAPSQNVWIGITHFDDSEVQVLRGLRIQESISHLIDTWGNKAQRLNVQLNFRVKACSATMPDTTNLMGKTNPHPVSFSDSEIEGSAAVPAENERGQWTPTFPLYAVVSAADRRPMFLAHPGGTLLPFFTSLEFAESVSPPPDATLSIHQLDTPQQTRDFISSIQNSVNQGPAQFDILIDSVDPAIRKQGVIGISVFLEAIDQLSRRVDPPATEPSPA